MSDRIKEELKLIDANAYEKLLRSKQGKGYFEREAYCLEPYFGNGRWLWENPEDYGIDTAIEELNNMPVIEAEPVKHGRWVECDYTINYEYYIYCSNCRAGFSISHMTFKRYCPNCGCKMQNVGV